MKRFFKKLKSKLNNKGAVTFEYIVIIAIVALIAVNVLPKIISSVSSKSDSSVTKIDGVETIFKQP